MTHPTVFGGATPPPASYRISNSVRCDSARQTYFKRTQTAGDRKTLTISFWHKTTNSSAGGFFVNAGNSYPFNQSSFHGGGGTAVLTNYWSSDGGAVFQTYACYRDPSAWQHFVLAIDTTRADTASRARLWVNGVENTSLNTYSNMYAWGPGADTLWNCENVSAWIGNCGNNTGFVDGYIADFHLIDGQALSAGNFGKTDDNGVWVPIRYTGTYGPNGCKLEFKNGAVLGTDTSGNGNHWTASGFTAADQMADSPTNNHATWNPLEPASGWAYSNGNLSLYNNGTGQYATRGTIGVSSGKWQWRVTINSDPASDRLFLGIATGATLPANLWASAGTYGYQCSGGRVVNGSASGAGSNFTVGDYLDFKLDMDAGTLDVKKNGNAMGARISGLSGTFFPCVQKNSGVSSIGGVTIDCGQEFTPDSGFKVLCTANLSSVAIKTPSNHFNAVLRSGTGATANITGVPFQPDFLWSKSRSNTSSHEFYDVVRGAPNYLWTDSTAAENNGGPPDTQRLVSFNSDGHRRAGVRLVHLQHGQFSQQHRRRRPESGPERYRGVGVELPRHSVVRLQAPKHGYKLQQFRQNLHLRRLRGTSLRRRQRRSFSCTMR